MRIRTIKPEFWSHPILSRLDDSTRVLAVGLLNIADDEGYFLADGALIRSALWPFDEESSKARRTLDALSRVGYVELREHATHGQIGRVVNFVKHQSIDRPKPSKIRTYFDSTTDRRQIDDRSLLEQGTGNREQGTGNIPPIPPKGEGEGGAVKAKSVRKSKVNGELEPIVIETLSVKLRTRLALIGALQHRDPETVWRVREVRAAERAGLGSMSDEKFARDLAVLQPYYRAKWGEAEANFTKRKFDTLCNGWDEHVAMVRAAWATVRRQMDPDGLLGLGEKCAGELRPNGEYAEVAS